MNRSSTVTSILVAATLTLAWTPQTAWAQDAAAPDPKALLKQGNKLFQEGDYPAAYEQFKAGYDIKPDPVFTRSMAYSLLKMLQHQKAKELLLGYLKKWPRARDRKKIKEIITGLDVVLQTRVEITSNPPGADIYIDTEAGGKVGVTPYKGTIEPGAHMVILKSRGFRTTSKDFKVDPKQKVAVAVPLEVPVKVTSDPAGAEVRVGSPDGPVLGKTPVEVGLAPGKRAVYLTLSGHKTVKRTLNVAPNKGVAVAARMLLGFRVASVPAGARVTLDGKRIKGVTPLDVGAAQGSHKVTVSLGTFKPVVRTVNLRPGQSADVKVVFQGGLLSMRTGVAGARVNIGALKLGETPLERAVVPRGAQEVSVSHPDRRDFEESLSFNNGEVLNADLEMGRPLWPVWTAGGLTLAGIVAGTVTGLLSRQKVAEANESSPNLCQSSGEPYPNVSSSECGWGLHHASTASFITAGVAAGVGLVYYLVWGRPSLKVKRAKLAAAR